MPRLFSSAPDPSPVAAAARAGRRSWLPRLLLASVVLVAAVVVGGRAMASMSAADTGVWVVRNDQAAGATLRTSDLVLRHVRRGLPTGLYLTEATPLPDRLVLTRSVEAGELVPRSALARPDEQGPLLLPLVVARQQLPSSVGVGSVVDVYLTGVPVTMAGEVVAEAPVGPVISGVTVVDLASDRALGVESGESRQMTVAVTDQQVNRWFERSQTLTSPTAVVVVRSR